MSPPKKTFTCCILTRFATFDKWWSWNCQCQKSVPNMDYCASWLVYVTCIKCERVCVCVCHSFISGCTFTIIKCYVFFPTEGYGGNLNFEKNEKEWKSIILKFEMLPLIVQ